MKSHTPRKGSRFLLLWVIMWTGCLDIEVSTDVAPDGSCERIVTVEGDSSNIFSSRFPIPMDSTWQIDLVQEDEDSYVYTARKRFANISELNREFVVEDSSEVAIGMQVSLEKRFHWFFSSLEYRERYAVNNPIDEVPLSDYLSEDEIVLLIRSRTNGNEGEDGADTALLDDLEERFNGWYARNVFEAFYRPFSAGVDELGHNVLTPQYLAAMKERLFQDILTSSSNDGIEFWVEHFEAVLGTPAVRQVVAGNPHPFRTLEAQMEIDEELFLSDYSNSVSLPGLIVKTNANTLKGNQATWDDIAPYLLYSEYEMVVKSRMLNWAVTIISAIILVLLAGGLVARVVTLRRE
ncbi:hypothetical protein ACFL4U_02425 [Candidatus Neomarinimicrobiota bacterium]